MVGSRPEPGTDRLDLDAGDGALIAIGLADHLADDIPPGIGYWPSVMHFRCCPLDGPVVVCTSVCAHHARWVTGPRVHRAKVPIHDERRVEAAPNSDGAPHGDSVP